MNQATKTIEKTTSTTQNATPRTLPRPQLKDVNNLTGLPSFTFMDMGVGRKFFDVVVVKASFDLTTGVAKLSPNQSDICLADELWQDAHDNIQRAPEYSSLKAVGDTVLYKPLTDIYVTGTARTFQNKPQTSWHGALFVRQGKDMLVKKIIRFTGPRQWRHTSANIWKLTPATPTTHVPMRYELAYGGHYIDVKAKQTTEPAIEAFDPNPAGSGYFGPLDSLFSLGNGSPLALHKRDQTYVGPQIDWPTDRISTNTDIHFKTYRPAGWGPIARWWSPRVARQGSYDAAWLEDFE
jgi:hypothetical protein